jgi:hypothetical protein
MAKQTIEQWMTEVLNEKRSDGAGGEELECTQLALVHRVMDKKQEVFSTNLKGRQWNVKQLSEVFRAKAENFAAELNGTQMFNILAFYGNRTEHQALKAFHVIGQVELEGMSTEPPTKEGMFSQGMRHLEAAAQTYIKGTAHMMDLLIQHSKQLSNDNVALRRENTEQMSVVSDAILKVTEMKDTTVTKHLEFQRATKERQLLLSMAPPLVNSLFGKTVFPEASADTALLKTLASNLTEEEILKLQGSMRPELWGLIAKRLTEIVRAENATTQAAAE